MNRKKLKNLICSVFAGGAMLLGNAAEAGIVTDRFPIQMYAEQRVYSYNSAGASGYAGWADGSTDLIRVIGYQNGWVHVYHPGSGGRTVNRWCKADELFANPGYSNRSAHVSNYQTVYRTSSSGTQFGSVNNEDVIVLAEKNNRAQILYRLDNGQGYKVGWIASSAVASNGGRNTNITNPIQTANDYVPINDGWYKISPAHDPGRSLDGLGVQVGNGNNLHMWDTLDVDQQKFYVQNRGNGYFSLQSAYGSKLYVTADGRAPGANLSMQSWNGSDSQLFRLKNSGKSGYYYIMAKVGANLLFDCSGGGRSNGNNVGLWSRDNESAGWYKWKFTSIQKTASSVKEKESSKIDDAMDYVASLEGRSMDYDGAYGAQCVDLIKYYYKYLGVANYARGNGKDYATNALPPGWQRIKGAIPQKGDILVYTSGGGGYGHVAIAESPNVSWHQNFNGKYVRKISGNYNTIHVGYWGVIRPVF